MYESCAGVVETKRQNAAGSGIETTNILNELLANDTWLEQVNTYFNSFNLFVLNNSELCLQQFRAMQDVWAEADAFKAR